MEKRKLKITLKVLDEVKVKFLQTKKFIEQRLEQEFHEENIPVEEIILLFTSLEANHKHRKAFFYFVVLVFKV